MNDLGTAQCYSRTDLFLNILGCRCSAIIGSVARFCSWCCASEVGCCRKILCEMLVLSTARQPAPPTTNIVYMNC